MQLPDVNVLIYAHREDAREHERYAAWLRALTEAGRALCRIRGHARQRHSDRHEPQDL